MLTFLVFTIYQARNVQNGWLTRINMQGRAQGILFAKEISLLPLAFFLALQPANALTTKDIEGLTYSQIKGTGIANRCPEASSTGKEQEITLDSGTKYKLVDFCLEPKSFQVEQETEKRKGVFVKGEQRAMHIALACRA